MASLASFRDPGGFCFVHNKRFFRAVSPDAVAEISPFLNSDTAKALIGHRHLIASQRLSTAEQEEILQQAGFRQLLDDQSIGAVFEHKRIDFPSYPYEWAPEMLFAAAMLTLDLAQSALKAGYCLKDASPYNILYQGCDPIFIDLLSFELRNPRDPIWKPHSQFCRNFLLPLLAHKHWGISLSDIFGTRRDGLDPTEVYRLCSATQRLRRPFFSLVSLPTWLSRKATNNAIYRDRLLDNPEKARFILTASFNRLRRALQAVRPGRNGKSHWTQYSDTHSYSETAFRAKEQFLSAFLRDAQPRRVLDIGANTGHFSALAAKSNADVVAIDSDAACIGILLQRVKTENLSILPLVVDVSRPSAAKGWRNGECARFLDRACGAFDAAVFFGVLHHLLVTERVPLKEILELAAELTRQWLVIEFIPPQDEMFKIIANVQEAEDFNRMTSFEERPQIFQRFIESIRKDSTPALNFLHILLPHAPWEYLPSGKKHSLPENNIRGLVGMNDEGIDVNLWNNDPWALQQAQKKHLLQVEMMDRLVGDLIRHLEEIGMFRKSLVVITADHGTSFHPNVSRRSPSRDQYADIVAIPLFIKYPNQDKGGIDDTVIETIDILPTLADSLGVRLPWKIHGQSALNSNEPPKTRRTIILGTGERMVVGADLSAIYQSIREKESTFGRTPEDLFRIGSHAELVGKSVRDLKSTRSSIKCRLEGRTYFENVDLNSQFILSNIKGALMRAGSELASPGAVAISINGTIAGVTQAYPDPEDKIRFSLVVSDSCFRSGSNQVRIYLISETSNGLELVETEDGGIPSYRWGERLTFGGKGTATIYQTEGWSDPEDQIAWTSGRTAELVLPVQASRKAIKLRMLCGAYLKPGILDKQRVKLCINRQPVADWVLSSRDFEVREAILPAGKAGNSGNLVVTFELPDCVSPNAIGDGEDMRRLGLAASWLSLSENLP